MAFLFVACCSATPLSAQVGGGSETHFQWDGGDKGYFGMSVSNAGDINQDGIEDVMVGSPWARPDGVTRTGAVFVYSGSDGTQLMQIDGLHDGETFGRAVSSAGDFNDDGHADFLASSVGEVPSGLTYSGEVDLYSGVDGSLMYRWSSEDSPNYYGTSVSSTNDINGDGLREILVGDVFVEHGGPLRSGSASLLSFKPFLSSDLNTISVGSGGTLTLENDFPIAADGHDFKVLMSASGTGPSHYGVDIPLTQDGLVLDTFAGIYPFATPTNMHGILDASGDATSTLTIAGGLPTNLIGRNIYMAAIANSTGQLPEFSSAVVRVEMTL